MSQVTMMEVGDTAVAMTLGGGLEGAERLNHYTKYKLGREACFNIPSSGVMTVTPSL